MKICHISTVHPQYDIRIFEKQCKSLRDSGHNITLLINNDKDELKDGIKIKSLKSRKSKIARLLLNLPYTLFYLLKNKYDIYHAHDPELIPILYFLRLLGRNVVYDMHENFTKEIKHNPYLNIFIKKIILQIWPLFEKKFLSKMNVIYAETSYKKDYPYILNSIDVLNMPLIEKLKKIKTDDKHKRFTFGYVGVVSRSRNIIEILISILNLQKKGYDVGFECIGPISSKELRKEINKISKKINNFRYYDELPPKKSWEIISKCHVGLAILNDLPNYNESLPTKIFEYLAFDMPIVTSNFTLYKSITDDMGVGISVSPNNINNLENALSEIINNKALYNNFVNNIRNNFNEKFSWENEYKKLIFFYKKLAR